MAKTASPNPVLLSWSKHSPTSEVQDPLGTSLRGSARLASRLLYCITSITPRARYFSFIPWCVIDHKRREHSPTTDLRKGISLREQALTLGCVANHDGNPCPGGALVGSRAASRWLASHPAGEADFRRLNFVKNPALNAYYNSLGNLGVFVRDDELPDSDEDGERTFDDIELSELGLDLASRYDSCAGRLEGATQIASPERRCSVESLKTWGERGGLCELSDPSAPDRSLLRDIFFSKLPADFYSKLPNEGKSHFVRRRSLLLILELCRQLNDANLHFDHANFAKAVYYSELTQEGETIALQIPQPLADIVIRWRLFYFHYFMSVALEGLLSCLVSRLVEAELSGESLDSILRSLSDRHVLQEACELLSLPGSSFSANSSPSELFTVAGVRSAGFDAQLNDALDDAIRPASPMAESALESVLRQHKFEHRSTGLIVSLILLATTLGRYRQWEGTKYGDWFVSVAVDRYLDLIPPIVSAGLSRRFGDWWHCSWKQIAEFVLSRYVIQQHQAMSYEKTVTGERCILQVHGESICATGSYDKIGIGNPRFDSAVQILTDLGLLEQTKEGRFLPTREGLSFLRSELAEETEE